MQIPQSNQDLRWNELGLLFCEPLFVANVVVQIAPSNEVKEEINSKVVLKHVGHVQDERVLRLEQNIFLCPCVNYLPLFDQYIFVDSFHSVFFSILGVNHQVNLSKRPFVYEFFNFEIF